VGRTSDAIVSTLDVLPTFASLAGVAPADRTIDGVNQRDLFLGRDQNGARDRFFYYDGPELQAVRVGPWKLRLPNLDHLRDWPEFDRGSQETELYHLRRDIGETNNVAAEEPEAVSRLMAIAKTARGS
jgi:arylsulfatase A-like enzyme